MIREVRHDEDVLGHATLGWALVAFIGTQTIFRNFDLPNEGWAAFVVGGFFGNRVGHFGVRQFMRGRERPPR